MALIKCPECGSEVSDKAVACPRCGCPIKAEVGPTTIEFERSYAIRYTCTVTYSGNEYTCKQGETITLNLSGPTNINIKISGGNGSTSGIVSPGRKYLVTNGGGFMGFKPVLKEYTNLHGFFT